MRQTHAAAHSGTVMVYVSGYTKGAKKGLYYFHLDLATGSLKPAGEGPDADNPSFMALHPNGRFLYAVNEIENFHGEKSGAVTAYAVDPANGHLRLLDQQPAVGTGSCHLALDREGKTVLVANYGSGSFTALPVKSNGELGPHSSFFQHHGHSKNPARQEGPHAHCAVLDAQNRFAFCCDLGLDKVMIYHFNASTHTLRPADPPYASIAPGSGPRHMAFHPNGRFAYVINELNSTLTVFQYQPGTGHLRTVETVSTLPKGWKGTNYPAEVAVSPDGRFVYGSNRGHDSIVCYRVDRRSGRLRLVGHQLTGGKNPRHFRIDPSGRFLLAANQDTGNVVVFRLDPKTGGLHPTGVEVKAPSPVCVIMRPLKS